MDESDFENSTTLGKIQPVAIDNKHAYKTVVINPIKSDPSLLKAFDKVIPKERDRINNLAQKEKRLEEAGVTRRKAYQKIADALDAVKTIEYRDSQGNVRHKTEPDFEKNKWGAEMAMKMFGDLIERKEVEYDIGDKTLDRFKALSVAELKARAADLILGKPVSRLPAIDVEVSDK